MTRREPLDDEVRSALAWLERHGSRSGREGMARYGVSSDKAFGVSMANIQVLAKRLGRSHELAAALWTTDRYEARMLTAFVDEPERVTSAQMDRWCRDFDNWAIVDTLCFHLFDRTATAWSRVKPWSAKKGEFARRAAFALLWALALHDKAAGDAPFLQGLRLIEAAAGDDRNFVKKAVHMALGAIGRRSPALHAASVSLARRLAASPDATRRWIGKDALRELTSPRIAGRFAKRVGARRAKGAR
jgi:3-methyladenine DNA glycosylase AlkD